MLQSPVRQTQITLLVAPDALLERLHEAKGDIHRLKVAVIARNLVSQCADGSDRRDIDWLFALHLPGLCNTGGKPAGGTLNIPFHAGYLTGKLDALPLPHLKKVIQYAGTV